MADIDEFVKEFLGECRKELDLLDGNLVALEERGHDPELLNGVFRTLHTIKGNAGFLDFVQLGELAHAGETLLERLRGGELALNSEITDALLQASDGIRRIMGVIESTGREGTDAAGDLRERLKQLAEAEPSPKKAAQAESIAPKDRPQGSDAVFLPTQEFSSEELDLRLPAAASPAETAPAALERAESSANVLPKGTSSSSSIIRVDVDLLDQLMNLVGELVLARNQILQVTSLRRDVELVDPVQRLNVLTTELQEGVMKTRMQQIGTVWQRYPRLVRDLARACNKEVKLEMYGADTELDKTLVEAISDPLVHLVRNAIDHGIEKPYLRRLKGKPDQGRLTLRAFHEGGQVHIEIADDGAGLDLEKIRTRAIQRGLVSVQEASSMTEAELHGSIFLAGFSTADKITNVSGRGVGMDVVKTSIEAIGGTIEINSIKDAGTTFRLTVPLTLAIVPALIVQCDGQRFVVPQINVVELLTVGGAGVGHQIEQFSHKPVMRFRGELVPVVLLSYLLGLTPDDGICSRRAHQLAVLRTGTRLFALAVDAIGNAQEIVVKPLDSVLSGLAGYAGATVMGDGSVALILDVTGIARRAGLFASDQALTRAAEAAMSQKAEETIGESLLVADASARRRVAVPLKHVVRIEEIKATDIEFAVGREVIQYRGAIMPLVRAVTTIDDMTPEHGKESLKLVVCHHEGHTFGLIIRRVIDIAEMPLDFQSATKAGLVAGTCIILGRVTEVLDIQEFTQQLEQRLFEPAATE